MHRFFRHILLHSSTYSWLPWDHPQPNDRTVPRGATPLFAGALGMRLTRSTPSDLHKAVQLQRPTDRQHQWWPTRNGGGSTTHDSMVAQAHHLQVDVKKICKRTGPSRGRSKVIWSVRTRAGRPSLPHAYHRDPDDYHRARLKDNGSGCRSTCCDGGIRSIGSSLGANAGVLAGGRRHRRGRVLGSKVLHPPYSVIIVMMV